MEVHEEDEGAEDHADVADHVHHERLARSHDRRVALIPEADQQVRAQADHRPADYQEDEVVGEDEQEHGVAQPLSSLRSSMSSASRTRKMSTRIASPTTASAAATVIDISAKS